MAWIKQGGGLEAQTKWDDGLTIWDVSVSAEFYSTLWDYGDKRPDNWDDQDAGADTWSKQSTGVSNWT
jgi:hypothetical protein